MYEVRSEAVGAVKSLICASLCLNRALRKTPKEALEQLSPALRRLWKSLHEGIEAFEGLKKTLKPSNTLLITYRGLREDRPKNGWERSEDLGEWVGRAVDITEILEEECYRKKHRHIELIAWGSIATKKPRQGFGVVRKWLATLSRGLKA